MLLRKRHSNLQFLWRSHHFQHSSKARLELHKFVMIEGKYRSRRFAFPKGTEINADNFNTIFQNFYNSIRRVRRHEKSFTLN
jgi:hypothetical protein